MNDPLVTLILPVYNVEKYVEKCIESVVDQSYNNLEIILVDDGSTDSSSIICERWEQMDQRIKTIRKENAGLGMARNTGLEHTTGEYVWFIDSDDFISKNAVEILVNSIHDADIVYCGHFVYYNEDNIISRSIRYGGMSFSGREVSGKILSEMMGALPHDDDDIYLPVSVWHGIYSMKSILENNIRFPSEREVISEDMIFHTDLLPKVQKVSFVSDCLYYYRKNNEGSLTTVYNPKRFEKEVILYKELHKRLACIMPSNIFELRLQRTFLGRTRSCIVRAVNHKGNTYQEIKAICSDEMVQNVLASYPYEQCGFRLHVFNFCIKHKFAILLKLLVIMRCQNR